LNVDNGFPIKNWFDDKKDRELFNISPILEFLAYVTDVRDFIKKMTDNNEISYPKAVSILNSYKMSRENINRSNNENKNPISTKSSTPTIKNIKDYTYKILKDERLDYNYLNNQNNLKRSETNNSKILQPDDRNIPKYSSNLVSQREKSQLPLNSTSLNTNRYLSNQNEMINSYDQLEKQSNLKKEADKQNINIKIINNHINNFILNPNDKKIKSINTFRNSNVAPTNQSQTNMEKTNNIQVISRSNNNIDFLKNSQQGQIKPNNNVKNLNINLDSNTGSSNEIRSNIMKNSQILKSGLNKTINTNQINPNVKYSSLIDNNSKNSYNFNNYTYNTSQSTVRPSSAIGLKAKHTRDSSNNSNKNENIYSSMNRTPSTKNLINAKNTASHINSNYLIGYDPINNHRETPKRAGIDQMIPNRTSQGSKSVRSISQNERLRYNYNSDINQLKPGRYDNDESITARGYYFSSRAGDIKNKYIVNPTQSVNYSSLNFIKLF
jgi:hypothetical protein